MSSARGDHREAIYRDDKDWLSFVSCLEEARGETGWQVHTYVLMGNSQLQTRWAVQTLKRHEFRDPLYCSGRGRPF